MKSSRKPVDLSLQEIGMIQSALQTQEKILSLQSRAGVDTTAKTRLNELKSVIRRLRRLNPSEDSARLRACRGRALFG